jgi:hypothetical protein
VIGCLARKRTYVNHYSFHIMDSRWGHLTIKMAGHAPFAAQVILNGHEYVAVTAQAAGIAFTKEGNCFTGTTDPAGLAQIADILSQDAAAGRLGQVIDRWICTACLILGLDLADQQRTCFAYAYSVYQAEYSRDLLFAYGGHMDRVFNAMLDRTRFRLDIPDLRTLFGARRRPGKYGTHPSPPGPAARTISALPTLRDHVIAPILAGVQIRRHDRIPARLTPSTRTTNISEPTWPPVQPSGHPARPSRGITSANPNSWRSWIKRLDDCKIIPHISREAFMYRRGPHLGRRYEIPASSSPRSSCARTCGSVSTGPARPASEQPRTYRPGS